MARARPRSREVQSTTDPPPPISGSAAIVIACTSTRKPEQRSPRRATWCRRKFPPDACGLAYAITCSTPSSGRRRARTPGWPARRGDRRWSRGSDTGGGGVTRTMRSPAQPPKPVSTTGRAFGLRDPRDVKRDRGVRDDPSNRIRLPARFHRSLAPVISARDPHPCPSNLINWAGRAKLARHGLWVPHNYRPVPISSQWPIPRPPSTGMTAPVMFAGVRPAKERDRRGHLGRDCIPAERTAAMIPAFLLSDKLAVMSCAHKPGRDDVGGDAARSELACQRPGQAHQPGLGGVVGLAGRAVHADDGGDDERAARIFIMPRAAHFGHPVRADQVHLEHLGEVAAAHQRRPSCTRVTPALATSTSTGAAASTAVKAASTETASRTSRRGPARPPGRPNER